MFSHLFCIKREDSSLNYVTRGSGSILEKGGRFIYVWGSTIA